MGQALAKAKPEVRLAVGEYKNKMRSTGNTRDLQQPPRCVRAARRGWGRV
jgi:hypothetical protein